MEPIKGKLKGGWSIVYDPTLSTVGTPYRNYYSFWNRLRRFFYKTKKEKEWHALLKEVADTIKAEIDAELKTKSFKELPTDPTAMIQFPDKPYL